MRLNRLGQVALNDQGRAIVPWLNDTTVGPYQREIGPEVWQMVTRTNGVVTPLPGVSGGANAVAAGGDQWMRRLDIATPKLSGSHVWTPLDGRVGDIDGNIALTLSDDKLTIRVFVDGLAVRDIPHGKPFDDPRLKGALAAWTEFNRTPNLVAWDVLANVNVTVQALPGPQYTPIVFDAPSGRWVLYQTDAMGGVCHRIEDASQGYRFGTPESVYDPDVIVTGNGCLIGWSTDAGQFQPTTKPIAVLGENMVPLVVPVPPVEEPIGPRSQPLPEGTEIDLGAFFVIDDRSWPRGNKPKGDTHGMDMQAVIHKGRPCIWFAKFDSDGFVAFPPAPTVKGSLGELLTVDDDPDGYIHLLADCSDSGNASQQRRAEVGTETDTRWLKKKMRIGRQYGLTTPQHQLIKWDRAAGQEIRREDFNREMWLESVWPKFYCGLQWGECEVVRYVMNNTGYQPGGTGNPDLWVETYYLARKKLPDGSWQVISWGDWTSDASNVVFAGGGVTFPNPPTVHSDFWHLGGQRYPPNIPSFIPLPQFPSEPPVPPIPTPTPGELRAGQRLLVDQPFYSQDKRYWLLYQRDGNLAHYGPGLARSIFTGLVGKSPGSCDMQGDGNFVVYGPNYSQAYKATNTHGNPGAFLVVQNDSNVVVYSASGKPLWARGQAIPPGPEPPIPPIPPGPVEPPAPIRVDGTVFRRPDNSIFSVRSTSSFLMLRRLLEGDVAGVRADMRRWYQLGYRELRVFSRVDWNGSPGPGLFPERYPNYWQDVNRFFTLAKAEGLYIEFVALTGMMPGGYNAMRDWVNQCQLARSIHVNAFLEVCNEPPVNGVDIGTLMNILDTSGWAQPWSTGQYDPTAEPAGSFCTPHTDRVDGWEWVRKCKDLYEYRVGGGPQNPTDPAMRRPIVGDEPMGAASFYSPGRRDNVPVHHYTAAALSTLLGAGYCCHTESGLNSIFPSGVELDCVTAAVEGMKAVAPEWQTGQYSRVGLSDFPIVDDPSVRTYGTLLNGRWKVVRVGPSTPLPVLAPGWRITKVDSHSGLNIVLELDRI